jgi:hypothetical protein
MEILPSTAKTTPVTMTVGPSTLKQTFPILAFALRLFGPETP